MNKIIFNDDIYSVTRNENGAVIITGVAYFYQHDSLIEHNVFDGLVFSLDEYKKACEETDDFLLEREMESKEYAFDYDNYADALKVFQSYGATPLSLDDVTADTPNGVYINTTK